MEPHRRNRLKELISEQEGTNTLVLNDLMMGDEGAKTLYELVPLHHRTLRVVELKGNNISPYGFELICSALLDCQGLKSLLVEWNTVGLNATIGLNALLKLARNTHTLQHIDLKNNRIDHLTVQPICQLIRTNLNWLRTLDLRWNELGEIGGRAILAALSTNIHLRVLEVHNNRIGEITMAAIEEYLVMGARRGAPGGISVMHPPITEHLVFPISQNDYPDITTQSRLAQLRGRIETEQREGLAYRDKMQVEINSVLSAIKLKGVCMQQAHIRLQSLISQQVNLKEQIKDAEQMFLGYRESITKVGYEINVEQTDYRRGKYNLSRESQDLVKKLMERNELEIADFSDQMAHKENYLAGLLSERLLRKKDARDKLISLEDDCLRFNMDSESMQHTTISKVVENEKKRFSDTFRQATEKVKEQQANVAALKRKNEYLNNELTQCVVRGLEKVRKLEGDIFELQKKVKKLHDGMTHINLDIDSQNTKLQLFACQGNEREQAVQLLRRQVSSLMSQGNIMLDLVRQNQTQERRTLSQSSESLYGRILQLQKAIRNQESSNKMVKNHYDKLCNMLQTQAQNAIYYTMTGTTSIT